MSSLHAAGQNPANAEHAKPGPPKPNVGANDRWIAAEAKRFFRYVLRYKLLLTAALLMGLAKFALQFAFPWIFGTATDYVITGRVGEGDNVTIIPEEERWSWLIFLVEIGVVALILYAITTFFRDFLTGKLGFRVIRDLRQDLFDHLHRLSLHFYSKERTGSIVSRVISDISQASGLVNGGVVTVGMDIFMMIFGIVALSLISWKLTLIALIVLPLNALVFKVLNPKVKHAGKLVQRSIGRISGNVQEQLAGISLVQASAAEGRESRRFRVDTEEHYDRVVHQKALSAIVATFGEVLGRAAMVAVIGFGGWMAINGEISAGDLIKFLGYLGIMMFPVQRFAEVNVVYQTCMASLERIFKVFDITPKITEDSGAHDQPPERGEVVFDNVRFSYNDDSDESRIRLARDDERGDDVIDSKTTAVDTRPDPLSMTSKERRTKVRWELAQQIKAERNRKRLEKQGRVPVDPPVERKWVLDGLSFRVEPGQKVALVGPSGSGKTTLVSLLPRLYDVAEGSIQIDGRDIREYRKAPLREAIGIVQQDSFLFSGSVKENLLYGRPGATFEEVIQAAKDANAHKFIEELPEGYDTPLGERGINLSGGQRQRLSIARAILKDPKLLILDEATSALDVESERLVQEALERLMHGRTCFIIAHRLSTIRNADRIFVV
ncbi:MAG: ABC transporter ATP-binding protein, partial [Planctomycetota bacterium]